MTVRRDTWAVAGCALLVGATLLACKKKKEEAPPPVATAATTTAATAATTAAPTTSTKLHNVGDTGTAVDYKLTVHNVKECKSSYYTKRKLKKNNTMLLGVEVTMESISDKNFYASQSNAKVIDSEGHTFKYSFYGKCEPRFRSSGALNKGEKVKGWMTFEVPTKATGLKFAYQPLSSFRGPKQILKFDLGR